MISNKMMNFVKNTSAIRAMFEEGKIMREKYGADNVFDFSLGNPSVEPPVEVKNALLEILNNESPNFIHGYTNNSGYEDIREYIANFMNKEHGTTFKLNNVIMTNGAAGAMNIILKTILNPNDEVIVFSPYFGEYKNYIENYDGKLCLVPVNNIDFQIDMELFEKNINKNTKCVIINTPHNPTGAVYTEETIKKLSEILNTKQIEFNTSIYLISDEPYIKLAYDNVSIPFIAKYYKNTFISYSFSKSLSLPGERIGYAIANSDMDDFEDIMFALNVANRICGFVNAPSLFQRIIPYCMDSKVDIDVYNKNRNKLFEIITELGFECVKPKGAFYMFPKSLIPDDVEFCKEAKKYNLLIVPGSSFGLPGYFRIAYCVPYEMIVKSIDSFKKLADKYKRWLNDKAMGRQIKKN